MTLPPKVSGFFNEEPPVLLPVQELQHGLEGLRHLQGFVDLLFADCSEEPSRSYHWAILELEEGIFFLFLNKYHRLVACSRILNRQDWLEWDRHGELPPNEYAEHEGIERILAPHFTCLLPDLLRMPIDPDKGESVPVVKRLELAEFAEFSFWEPRNIGQVVFNNWEKH